MHKGYSLTVFLGTVVHSGHYYGTWKVEFKAVQGYIINLKPAWTYIGRPCHKTRKAGHLTQWLNICLALCKVLGSKRRNTTKTNTERPEVPCVQYGEQGQMKGPCGQEEAPGFHGKRGSQCPR